MENVNSNNVIKSADAFAGTYSSFKNHSNIINKFSTLTFNDFYKGEKLNNREEKSLVIIYQEGKSLIDAYNSGLENISQAQYDDILEFTNRAMDLLVFQFFGLAIFHAKRYRGMGVDYQDLVQLGLTAILQIVQNYSYGSKRALSTEISWRMRNKMYRALASSGSSVKLPEETYQIYYQYKLAEEKMTELKSDDEIVKPSRKEILEKIGVDEKSFIQARRFAYVLSLDNTTDEYDDSVDIERLINNPFGTEEVSFGRMDGASIFPKFASQEIELLNKETDEEIKTLINNLPEQNKIAITMRFGFDDGKCKSFDEIAKALNTYKVNASRLVQQAIHLLKTSLTDLNLNDYFSEN